MKNIVLLLVFGVFVPYHSSDEFILKTSSPDLEIEIQFNLNLKGKP